MGCNDNNLYSFAYGQQITEVNPSWPISFAMAGLVTWCETLGRVATLRICSLII